MKIDIEAIIDAKEKELDLDMSTLHILIDLAESGNVEAQLKLAVIYRFGIPQIQSHKKSRKWYRAAARQGSVKAKFNLGAIYEMGAGVKPNGKKAIKWMKEAAKQGDEEPARRLDGLYERSVS